MKGMMKAAVVDHVDAPWTLEDRPVPAIGPNDVLVRIHASGICGTDAWMTNGTLEFHPFPLLLGHEGVGEIVAVGDAVTTRKIGDRVGIPMVQQTCGKCEACLKERPNSFAGAFNCTGGPA